MFAHEFINLPSIDSVTTDSGRYYTTPNGKKYQSVTTFLSRFSDNSWLKEWKDRVGEDKAKRVSTQSTGRGTAVHSILERIVLNDPFYMKKAMPNNLMMAESIANVLRARVNIIKGVEIGLWSDNMQIAGRADLFADFDGINSIVDFKTSKYLKEESDINNYFIQCTLYALMVEELTGISVPQIVVLIGVDFEDTQVFVKNKKVFMPQIINMLC